MIGVTIHLRNQIQAAVGHALARHVGPLSVANTITDAVVVAVNAHDRCSRCSSHTAPDSPPPYVVKLPWPKPPLSLNDRMHWRPKYEKTKRVQGEALFAVRATRRRLPQLVAAEVVLCWRVPDLRARDLDNVVATLKPAIDALVQAGVLPKDDWKHVRQASTRIDPPEPGKKVAVWLEITPREAYQ